MKQTVCDRCELVVPDTTKQGASLSLSVKSGSPGSTSYADLCQECLEEFYLWIENDPA